MEVLTEIKSPRITLQRKEKEQDSKRQKMAIDIA